MNTTSRPSLPVHQVCAIALAVWAALTAAEARACHDGHDMRDFNHNSAKLRVDVDGVRRYDFSGSCSASTNRPHPEHGHLVFTANATWDPIKNQATEQVIGNTGWQAKSAWSCPYDPWLQPLGAECRLLDYSSTGTPPPITKTWRPFSSIQSPAQELQRLLKKATPAPPTLPPRNPSASVFQERARISWATPANHTSMNPTTAWFRIERRLVDEPQAGWFPASKNLPVTRTVYDDPDPLVAKTEYRVCAINVSGARCSAPVTVISAATTAAGKAAATGGLRQVPLVQEVRAVLAKQFPRNAAQVGVEADTSGVITLEGVVRSSSEIQQMGEAAKRVPGVNAVRNLLTAVATRPDSMPLNPTIAHPQAPPSKSSGAVRPPGEAVMLNPQPLPPKASPGQQNPAAATFPKSAPQVGAATGVRTGQTPGGAVMLNPQPLPPKTSPGTQQ